LIIKVNNFFFVFLIDKHIPFPAMQDRRTCGPLNPYRMLVFYSSGCQQLPYQVFIFPIQFKLYNIINNLSSEEYYDALVAFKEKDPGKVGVSKVIPFSMTDGFEEAVASFLAPAKSGAGLSPVRSRAAVNRPAQDLRALHDFISASKKLLIFIKPEPTAAADGNQ
jgi:hypothetical protein